MSSSDPNGVAAKADLAERSARLDRWAADPVVYRVVEELATSGLWSEALDRARAAIRRGAERDRVLLHLMEGALASGHADRARKALGQVSAEGRTQPKAVRLQVKMLTAEGKESSAKVLVERMVLDHPGEAWATRWLSMHKGESGLVGAGPLETERRVRMLAKAGYPGRALRLARRIQLDHVDDDVLEALVVELADVVSMGKGRDDRLLAGLPLPELDDGIDLELEL